MPHQQLEMEIKVPPPVTISREVRRLTGTAFDYLLRFYLEKLDRSAISGKWVAEASLALLEHKPSERQNAKEAQKIVKAARELHASYLKRKDKEPPDETLIRVAIELAQLDPVYRGRQWVRQGADNRLVDDLRNLVASVPLDDFKAAHVCVLNPTFGAASRLVGGADADLFIDTTLIEIKTSKYLTETTEDAFPQLVGYYLLSCIGGIDGCEEKASGVAIYHARYGCLQRFAISDFMDDRRQQSLLKWFKARAKREFPPQR